eukprot:1512597-Pleurochrysis_carterae.AAC.1
MRLRPPQDRKARRAYTYRCGALHNASPLTCARMDAIYRMFTAVVKLHLASAAGCLTIAIIHTYWIHGSHALGLAEHSNPVLVTHVSRIDFNPAFDCAAGTITHLLMSAPERFLMTARYLEEMDKQFNDASVDFAIAFPSMLAARFRRAIEPSRLVVPEEVSPSPPPARVKGMSAPIATRSHALIASNARRNAPRRSRHLRDGRRSIGFVVDSGCTWHIHQHASDLVSVRPCEDRVVGIEGRPQRCTVIGDLPITASDKTGNSVDLTLKDTHYSRLSPAKATERMHKRLHAGATRLRALPSLTADAPPALAHGRFDGCAASTTANATRHVHDSTLYKPSYAGRLIHADNAGPFVRTHHTGYQYLLVLVDDHTRFKA